MKDFIKFTFIFSIPFIIITGWYLITDPFKVLREHINYHAGVYALNRDVVSTRTFLRNRLTLKYNSFIFGSSRSQAFKCADWKKHLPPDAKTFHFDANSEGIWGVWKKICYLDSIGQPIKYVLLVTDRNFFGLTGNDDGHLFIKDPAITHDSRIKFQYSFFKTLSDPKFLLANLDYTVFRKRRPYMADYFNWRNDSFDLKTNDIFYGWDHDIAADSLAYYKKAIKAFYQRTPSIHSSDMDSAPFNLIKTYLLAIRKIFIRQGTNYKIIISPLYDQEKIYGNVRTFLEQAFGKDHVYDFSGVNEYTIPLENYYEASHFRPFVANKIMDSIYR